METSPGFLWLLNSRCALTVMTKHELKQASEQLNKWLKQAPEQLNKWLEQAPEQLNKWLKQASEQLNKWLISRHSNK
jgi:F0F1-type ATP synthase membrane subunit b/b'